MLYPDILSTVCDAEDFFTTEFLAVIQSEDEVPTMHRKPWEYDMLVRDMELSGALHDRADALGLACGVEQTIFYVASRAKSVLATDLYLGSGNVPGWIAGRTLEADVFEHSRFPYPRERLTVRTMDMRRIEAPDESFDLVWSCSSIEHLASIADMRTTFAEVARALRPGGVYVFTTEWKLCGGFSYFPHGFIFDPKLLQKMIDGLQLEPIGQVDCRFSQHSLNTPTWRRMHHPSFRLLSSARENPIINDLPNIVLFSRGVLNTSVVVALRKSNRTGHRFDFIEQDPALAEWLTERHRRHTRERASLLTRLRLRVDGSLGAWIAEAHHALNERLRS